MTQQQLHEALETSGAAKGEHQKQLGILKVQHWEHCLSRS